MKEWLGQSFDSSMDPSGRPTFSSGGNKLDWSLDPLHSDWTIEIICKEDNTSTMYNVHKIILAVGPWKCEYFVRLLETINASNEDEHNVIRIKLHKLAADVIPQMLDYVYGAPTSPLKINTHTATGLHSLGVCFENKWLVWEAKQFWKNDISPDNAHIYYTHARILQDDYILLELVEMCAANINSISADTNPIVQVATPEFWFDVFDKRLLLSPDDAQHNNKGMLIPPMLIADVCEHHIDSMSNETLERLVGEELLPFINPDVGRRLLQKVDPIREKLSSLQVRCLTRAPASFIAEVCEFSSNMSADVFELVTCEEFLPELDPEAAYQLLRAEPKFIVSPDDKLTSLQKRCLACFCDHWGTLQNHNEIIAFLSDHNPLLVAEILHGTAAQLQALQDKLATTQSVLHKTISREREMRQDYERELERLHELLCSSVLATRGMPYDD